MRAPINKDTYRDVLMSLLRDLGWPARTDQSFEAMKVDSVATTEAKARHHTPSRPHKESGGGAEGDRDRPMERQPQA
jgi:hypothetical protein